MEGEKSSEMYSPDEQGEYMLEAGAGHFSVQGLMDVLTTLETEVTKVQLPSTEFMKQLEVNTNDCLGHPCTPAFS